MRLLKVINYLTLLTTLAILISIFSFAATIYHGPKVYPNHVHTTIYIDRNFDDFEQEKIISAAMKWTMATEHLVEYDIVQLPTYEKIDSKNGLFFVKISPDSPEIIVMDNIKKTSTLGYFESKYGLATISLVTDRLLDDSYEGVVMHEIGHSLGIDHLESLDDMDTLMFPYISMNVGGVIIPTGSDHITDKDLVAFCKLYHCDASKLKH